MSSGSEKNVAAPESGLAGGHASMPTATPGEGSSAAAPGRTPFIAGHKRAVTTALIGLLAFGVVYYVVPQIVGLGPTLRRLRSGDPWWLGLGVPLEALSLLAYAVLFRSVFFRSEKRIGWRASLQITLAGGAATKLFAAAGSGGVALTVWALRASGLAAEEVAQGMVSFEILTYAVYMASLAIAGFGLWIGLFPGSAPVALTLLPALFGLVVIGLVGSLNWLAMPTERFLLGRAKRAHGRAAGRWQRASRFPLAVRDGLRCAYAIVRGHDRSWLTTVPAWGFDIATLWVSFRAFGHSPPAAVLVMGYYVGTLANTLPLPGGIGAVEGGMIGAFLGFGVDGSSAVVAVLAYRTISYWLPLLPQGVGYVRLRHTVNGWRKHPQADASGSSNPPSG
jgi:uncharacterized protein (TIRG00374 family)